MKFRNRVKSLKLSCRVLVSFGLMSSWFSLSHLRVAQSVVSPAFFDDSSSMCMLKLSDGL